MAVDPGNPRLQLSDTEKTLRRLLLDVAAYTNPENPSELRITGGWVRDKLLGIQTHDIDVAINDMTGESFGLKMKEYLEIPGNAEKYGLYGVATSEENSKSRKTADKTKVVHGLHKIAKNPEKSKHLETVTTKLLGIDLDLLNLRKESYATDNRTPHMEFGTPQEDAMRRDATVNALFYNLRSESIEDLTGRGLNDLASGTIRTPLEPYQTFRDDPLRVLRLIRFSSTLGYSIADDTKSAMQNKDIGEALKRMISRERIGTEVEKMLRGPNPLVALELIHEVDLYHIIFVDPIRNFDFQPESKHWRTGPQALDKVLKQPEHFPMITNVLLEDAEQIYAAWILAALIPYADAPEPPMKSHRPPLLIPVSVIREGIKATNRICEIVALSFRNSNDVIKMKDGCVKAKQNTQSPDVPNLAARDTLGMAIRHWGPLWQYQVMYSLLLELTRFYDSGRDIFAEYEKFLRHIESLDLLSVNELKPIIDGKALADALNIRPGPWMKDAIEVVTAWQLRNPSTATAEGAIEAVKAKHGELTTSLVQHFLRLTIRPLFSKSQEQRITPQGRKPMQTKTEPRSAEFPENQEHEPWKATHSAYALEVLTWVVASLDENLTEHNWPLLVPPVLTLLDDTDIEYKAKGCDLLKSILTSTSPAFLARTGLGKVFEEAIEICLSYLPSLTPEDDSIKLLDTAYPCMLGLSRVQFPSTSRISAADESHVMSTGATRVTKLSSQRAEFLSRLLHQHILSTLLHISDSHPKLATSVLVHLESVLREMQVDTIAELMHVLPLLTKFLRNPFNIPENIRLSYQTAVALQATMAVAWPRIHRWRGEILMGLCSCWIAVEDYEIEAASKASQQWEIHRASCNVLRKELQKSVEMLSRAINSSGKALDEVHDIAEFHEPTLSWDSELEALVAAEPRIAGLVDTKLG